MFCPECKAEYRRGFTRCADCDVDLVYELPAAHMQAESQTEPLNERHSVTGDIRVLWRGIDQQSCVNTCYDLRDKNIAYKVMETPTTSRFRLNSGRRYELSVSSDDYERAKSALDIEEDPPATFSEKQWAEMEDPEDPDQPEDPPQDARELDDAEGGQSFSDDFTHELQQRRDAYMRAWYPEDATSEIWSQDGEEDISGAIEMTLKEHFIHSRSGSEGGERRVFVLPDDEHCARKIVREMLNDAPSGASVANGFQFCPLCLAEYRLGFNECSDCHLALVPTQAEASSASTRLWTGESDQTLDRILAALDAQNIRSRFKEQVVPRAQVTILGLKIGEHKSPFEYSVRVLRSDLERARAAIAEILGSQ